MNHLHVEAVPPAEVILNTTCIELPDSRVYPRQGIPTPLANTNRDYTHFYLYLEFQWIM
jgi:hypothetical protein